MTLPETLFEDAAIQLARALEPQGFRVVRHAPPTHAFRDRLATYRRGSQEVRLIWDVRQRHFLLQQTSATLDPDLTEPSWTDVVCEPYTIGETPRTAPRRSRQRYSWPSMPLQLQALPNKRLQLSGAERPGLRPARSAGGGQRNVEFGMHGHCARS